MVFRHECPQKELLLAAERPITLAPDAVGPDRGGSHLGCSPYGCLEPTGRRWWEFRIKGGRWQTILWHTAERYHPRQGWRPSHDHRTRFRAGGKGGTRRGGARPLLALRPAALREPGQGELWLRDGRVP